MTLLASRFDKKCGKSGIPDNAKCTKKTVHGRTIAQQKSRERVPKDKEYKRLRALENELNKEAKPKQLSTRQLTRSNRKLTAAEVKRLSRSQVRWREKNYRGKFSDEEFARRLLTPGTNTRRSAQALLAAPSPNKGKALGEGIRKGRKNPAPKGSSEAALHELRKREVLNRRTKFVATSALALGATANVITQAKRTYR